MNEESSRKDHPSRRNVLVRGAAFGAASGFGIMKSAAAEVVSAAPVETGRSFSIVARRRQADDVPAV